MINKITAGGASSVLGHGIGLFCFIRLVSGVDLLPNPHAGYLQREEQNEEKCPS